MSWIDDPSSILTGGAKYGGGGAGPSSAGSSSSLFGGSSSFSSPFTVNTGAGGSAGALLSPLAIAGILAAVGIGAFAWLKKKS